MTIYINIIAFLFIILFYDIITYKYYILLISAREDNIKLK